jgi:hypothetical protein
MSESPVDVSGDETRASARKTGRPNLDLIIAISAIVMSAISLFVAIENGISQRDLVAASTWPFLREIQSNDYNESHDLAIGFSNGGVGPAKIKSFEVFYKGISVSSGLDLLRKCCGLSVDATTATRQLPGGFNYSIADETVLRPGEDNPVLRIHRAPAAPDIARRFSAALDDVSFRVCYCSILDECWTSDLRSTRTTAVRECPTPARKFDPNGK